VRPTSHLLNTRPPYIREGFHALHLHFNDPLASGSRVMAHQVTQIYHTITNKNIIDLTACHFLPTRFPSSVHSVKMFTNKKPSDISQDYKYHYLGLPLLLLPTFVNSSEPQINLLPIFQQFIDTRDHSIKMSIYRVSKKTLSLESNKFSTCSVLIPKSSFRIRSCTMQRMLPETGKILFKISIP
jgi:hypothetical protein